MTRQGGNIDLTDLKTGPCSLGAFGGPLPDVEISENIRRRKTCILNSLGKLIFVKFSNIRDCFRLWIVRAWMYRFGGIGSEAFTPRIIAMAIAAPNIRDQYIMVVPHCGTTEASYRPLLCVAIPNSRAAIDASSFCSSNWRACDNALARTAVGKQPVVTNLMHVTLRKMLHQPVDEGKNRKLSALVRASFVVVLEQKAYIPVVVI